MFLTPQTIDDAADLICSMLKCGWAGQIIVVSAVYRWTKIVARCVSDRIMPGDGDSAIVQLHSILIQKGRANVYFIPLGHAGGYPKEACLVMIEETMPPESVALLRSQFGEEDEKETLRPGMHQEA